MLRYQAVECINHENDCKCYGILAEISEAYGWKSAAFVADISCSREFVSDLAEKCSAGQLDPIHIFDVVMDAIP